MTAEKASRALPASIAGWKAVAGSPLADECCAFHRNVEISARYASAYRLLPQCFKWAAMAAIASHHVRLVLFPLRVDADRNGYVDISRWRRRRRLIVDDVNTIRLTNNGIFDDIYWVHLAYAEGNGIERLRALLRPEQHYAAVLDGFEAIDRGRRVLRDQDSSPQARRDAEDLVWRGNISILEHEQRALVQPNFDLLSGVSATLISLGSATAFEARGLRQGVGNFTSFYGYSLTRGATKGLRARAWPSITRFDDRWRWITTSVVPRFRKFDSDQLSVEASLRRIIDEAETHASTPCMVPRARDRR